MMDDNLDQPEIIIEPPGPALDTAVESRLREELEACPDIAFAHLCRVSVPVHQPDPQLSLFVWLVPEAVASLRAALNLVSEAVARALPEAVFLDVLILNSAPELLGPVEDASEVFVERNADERRQAKEAARVKPETPDPTGGRRLWPW